jgi:2-keto-3-deoxy-L-rhamnonate aldolase RhmA
MNTLKNKLAKGEVCLGGWITIGHPAVAEIMVHAGFDWVAIDEEHGTIDFETGVRVLSVMRGTATVPFVRVRNNDELVIRRWLDAGAMGIIVPMINTAAQARAVVQAAKYPPQGRRGFGYCRANRYGAEFDEYVQRANDDIVLIAQIEHIEAVRNIDAVLDVDGIDGIFLGPYDLSGSMGLTGQIAHPDVDAAVETVRQACRRHNKVAGVHVVPVDPADVSRRANDGFTLIAASLDCVMLRYACEKTLAGANSLSPPRNAP